MRHSAAGFAACCRTEAAFRQELVLFAVLLPVIPLLPLPVIWKVLLFGVNTLVLVTELLNSALEAIVDKACPDIDDFAKRAKDMGSAAVLLSLVIAAAAWAAALWLTFA